MHPFGNQQSLQGSSNESDTMYAFDPNIYVVTYGEGHFENSNDMDPVSGFEHLHDNLVSNQQQDWQSQAQHPFTPNSNFPPWNGYPNQFRNFPPPSDSSEATAVFPMPRRQVFDHPISDTTSSTPTQGLDHSSVSSRRTLGDDENNLISSNDQSRKKVRIHATSQNKDVADATNGSKNALQQGISVKEIQMPYRNIWKMRNFNIMQSQMLAELTQGDENVVVTAPTGAGKTVLFEMAIIRMFQQSKDAKAVYLAPTKALCSEKFRDWKTRLQEMDCEVLEMTGDSKITTPDEIKAARLIIATPEKWNFITRRAERSDPLMSKLKLFLIDEVHSVREKVRGALLEVLIARTKSRNPDTRIIAVSATIPNADDVAQWIGSRQRSPRDKPERRKLTPFTFSDEFRPCPLQKEIYGFKPNSANERYNAFEQELTNKLPGIIEKYSKGKATLIFCSSRSGTQHVASALYQHCLLRAEEGITTTWPEVSRPFRQQFINEDLQELSKCGIAFHHAGLDFSDKRTVEAAFLHGQIKILCATTTLSVGVNLPAYLVIIRGTKIFSGAGMEEHSDLTIMQMMGRAGRPQFDKEGVCVIMTEHDRREHYEKLLKGQSIIESTLHLNLIEHINAEICARGHCRVYNIEKWLKETFLFVRMPKNWAHYSIEGCSDNNSPEENIEIIIQNTLKVLSKHDLIEGYDNTKPDQDISPTEYGRTMSNYDLRLKTMLDLKNLQEAPSLESLISAVCQASEFSDLFIRAGEKATYLKILRDLKLRFAPTRVEVLHEKVSVLLQSSLTGARMKELLNKESQILSANPKNEQDQIMKTAPKIARAMMNIASYRKDGVFLERAYSLSRSLQGASWDDEPATLTQLEGIGFSTMKELSQHNITSIKSLARANPSQIALFLDKSPMQASKLINEAKKIPQIHLDVREVEAQPTADGFVESKIKITLQLQHDRVDLKRVRLQTRDGKALSIGTIVYSTNINAKECQMRRAGIWHFTESGQCLEVKCRILAPSDEIIIVCAVEEIPGTSVTKKIKTSCPANRFPVHANGILDKIRMMESEMQGPATASNSSRAFDVQRQGEYSFLEGIM